MSIKINTLQEDLKGKLSLTSATKVKRDAYCQYKQRELLTANTSETETTLNNLNIKVEKLIKLYNKIPGAQKGGDSFFYQKPLEDFFKEEQSFTFALTEYTQKQFFNGIADLAGGKDSTNNYSLLDSTKPESFLIKGESSDAKELVREELRRLQSEYSRSKQNQINAELLHVKYKKAVEMAGRQLEMLKLETNFEATEDELSEQIENQNMKIKRCQNNINNCYASELLPLLEKLQALNSTKVIQGDYRSKLSRQDYLLSKQNVVIKELLLQFSRNFLLTMLYEMELKTHRNTYHLFTTIQSLLANEVTQIEKRLISLNGLLSSGRKTDQQTITSNDTHINRLYEAILYETSNKKELYRSYNDLSSGANQLAHSYKIKRREIDVAEGGRSKNLQSIASMLSDVESMLQSSTDESSEELLWFMNDIEENLSIAEIQINKIIGDIMEKKNLLSIDRSEELKRTVFADFFNDPTRLKRNLDELILRVNASTVS